MLVIVIFCPYSTGVLNYHEIGQSEYNSSSLFAGGLLVHCMRSTTGLSRGAAEGGRKEGQALRKDFGFLPGARSACSLHAPSILASDPAPWSWSCILRRIRDQKLISIF